MLAPPTTATSAPSKFHDVTVLTKKTYQCARVEGVPPEEFGIAKNAKSIRDSGYCFHETRKTQADLISQGFDKAQIMKLPSFTSDDNTERSSRDTVDENDHVSDDINESTREILVTEHYILMDYEGDGKAKSYKVTTAGAEAEILKKDGSPDIVEVDSFPFAAMTPVIITHRFWGKSIADLVMDIQRIKTALMRGMLDHVYMANNPRPLVAESEANESTLDDLLVSRHGAPIRAKTPTAVVWQQIPDIGNHVYPAIQYMDATREWRTGVTRQGQGLDADALQNQTATATNQLYTAAQARIKLIARIFAETGIKDLFSLLHATIRKHGSQAQTVRLRNQWVNVDPRQWKRRDDLTINVGLGTGGKSEQLAHLQLIIGAQAQGVAAGLTSKRNLFNSAKELTKLAGHKDVQTFFVDPDAPADPNDPSGSALPPPQDPKQAELAGKMEIEKLQAQADIATNDRKVQADLAMKDREFQFKSVLEQQKFELEREKMLLEMQIKREEHQFDMAAKQQMHQADMSRTEEKHAQSMEHADDKAVIAAKAQKAKAANSEAKK